jgi:inner membrane protein
MTGRTHDLAAITALIAVVLVVPTGQLTLATVVVALLANQIGGIVPDIDEPTAPFWRNLPVGGYFGRIIDRLLGGHRFLTHSLLGAGLLSGGLWLLLEFISPIMPKVDIHVVWWAFVIGLISHLVMDTFTKEGVPWLLPIPFKFGILPLRDLRITTGHAIESFVVFPGLMVVVAYLVVANYQQLLNLLHQIH